MRDTPRTEVYVLDPLPQVVSADWARQLERELNAAKARVAELEARCKLLELAGDNLDLSIACGCGVDGPCQMCRRASDSWKQAKEAKP